MARESAGPVVGKTRGAGEALGRDGAERPREGAGAGWEEGGTHGHLRRAEDGTLVPGGTSDGLQDHTHRECVRLPSGTSPPPE